MSCLFLYHCFECHVCFHVSVKNITFVPVSVSRMSCLFPCQFHKYRVCSHISVMNIMFVPVPVSQASHLSLHLCCMCHICSFVGFTSVKFGFHDKRFVLDQYCVFVDEGVILFVMYLCI